MIKNYVNKNFKKIDRAIKIYKNKKYYYKIKKKIKLHEFKKIKIELKRMKNTTIQIKNMTNLLKKETKCIIQKFYIAQNLKQNIKIVNETIDAKRKKMKSKFSISIIYSFSSLASKIKKKIS